MNRKQCEEMLEFLKQEVENKEYNLWIPDIDSFYWYINSKGESKKDKWGNLPENYARLNIGNVYKSQEEADFYLEHLKVKNELKKYSCDFKYKKRNYYMFYHDYNRKVVIGCDESIERPDIYFKSEERAEEVIKKVGLERIIKYYLGV